MFPAPAGMNRIKSRQPDVSLPCVVFPAPAGMNRVRFNSARIRLDLVFPAPAGMNRDIITRYQTLTEVFPAPAGMNRCLRNVNHAD